MSMFANAQTIIRWLKMTKVKDCGKNVYVPKILGTCM